MSALSAEEASAFILRGEAQLSGSVLGEELRRAKKKLADEALAALSKSRAEAEKRSGAGECKSILDLSRLESKCDLVLVIGFILVVAGVAVIYPPLALIVAGLGLMRLAYLLGVSVE